MKTIYMNEDNEHFYACHPPEDMTEAGVASLVDHYAETGTVKGILFCTNLQRALFDSEVWERFRDIRKKAPGPYPENLQLLSERGVDHFRIWLNRSAELGIEGWLSMRMNDSHGLKENVLGESSNRCCFWAADYWKQHPELRRAPYRFERDWEGSFNYLLPEVREHHLALIRELFQRYDMFGFECDWMRWGLHFAPGFERIGQKVLTEFVAGIRKIADEAEKRVGHPIRLAHRFPVNMESAWNAGYDFPEWYRRGCIDMVTLCSFLGQSCFDPQIRLWKELMPDCKFNVQVETRSGPYPGSKVCDNAILRGAAACAWNAGADALYFFNMCYWESSDPEGLNQLMKEISEPQALAGLTRRMIPASSGFGVEGESSGAVLPVPLIPPAPGCDLGRMEDTITLRLNAGTFFPEEKVCIKIGFDNETDVEKLKGMKVWLNTVPLTNPTIKKLPPDRIQKGKPFQKFSDYSRDTGTVLIYPVPEGILHAEFNALEFQPPAIPGRVVWAELCFN